MDTFTFIVEMTKALAWPTAVAVTVYLLRTPLINLVPYIEELKYKDFELKFRRDISKAKEMFESEVMPSPELSRLLEEENTLIRVAEISPRAAVIESWMSLQNSLLDISLNLGQIDNKENFREHSRVGHAMLDAKIFNKNDFNVYHKLRDLRNEATYAPDFAFNSQDAKEYVKLAMQLAGLANQRVVK